MDYLFLDPKVLNYSEDKYDLILMTLRWARAMKAKGSPDPMPVLVERALKDIVDNKVTIAEIMANKIVEPPVVEEIPSVVSVAGEGKAVLPPDDSKTTKKPKNPKRKRRKTTNTSVERSLTMILLGVTGSIAAYKAVEVLRLLSKAGEDVHVVMTSSATKFVGPLTFQGLSGHPVFSDPLDPQAYQMAHLALAEKADARRHCARERRIAVADGPRRGARPRVGLRSFRPADGGGKTESSRFHRARDA